MEHKHLHTKNMNKIHKKPLSYKALLLSNRTEKKLKCCVRK